MRPGRKDVRRRLERMGQVPVPPPAPGFAARLEDRFGAGHRVAVVADELALARSRRRAVRLGLVAAAAAGLLAVAVPQGDQDVNVATHGVSSSTTSSTTTTTTTRPPAVEPTTTTAAPAPLVTPTTVVRPAAAATTTTTAPAAVTTTTTTAPPPVTTTTKPIARLELRCAPAWEDTVPVVTCTWTGSDDPTFAGWRLHRATNGGTKQVVFTSADRATRTYADRDVVAGGTYQYVIEAVSGAGRTLAKGGVVEVACCPR
ncbi:MAG: hypothetical protein ACT4PX_00690 [Actinomycetota bacterium]